MFEFEAAGGHFFYSIRRFLYNRSTDAMGVSLTPEFDYRWELVKSGQFQQSRDQSESTKRWIAH